MNTTFSPTKYKKTNPKVSPNHKSSPSRSNKKTDVIIKMRKNREKLCNTLDTYTLLIRSNNPIRCLQHNSNISIYCQTQQKLLCPNCIFNKSNHKLHKLVAIDKSTVQLKRDIQIMHRHIDRETKAIQILEQEIKNNLILEEKDAYDMMNKLIFHYQNCRRKIDESFNISKETITNSLQNLRIKHETVLVQLNFLRKLYEDKVKNIAVINDQTLVYEHVTCSTIMEQGKFGGEKWQNSKNQIKKKAIIELQKMVNIEQKIVQQWGLQTKFV